MLATLATSTAVVEASPARLAFTGSALRKLELESPNR
jgi:hypothetical protein